MAPGSSPQGATASSAASKTHIFMAGADAEAGAGAQEPGAGTGREAGAGGPGGSADGGPADVLVPGPELAGLLVAVTGDGMAGAGGAGLGSLTDEEVLGVIAAGWRMAAWAGWVQIVGLAEFARRRGVMCGT